MKNSNNSKLIVSIILFISISFLASLTLLKNIEKTEFFLDESGWVSSGYYYSDLLLEGDFDRDKWNCEWQQCAFFNSLYNPHLGQWVIGIPLKFFAEKGERESFSFYKPEKSVEQNKKEGRIPPEPILLRARSVVVVIGILCCLLIYAIGYYCNNLWTGSIAAILLIPNELFITLSTQAMTDIPYNFFLLCACLMSIILLSQTKLRYILLCTILYGGIVGLATSVKITGILVGSLYFLFVMFYKKMVCNLSVKDMLQSLAAFSISALFIIYLLNPYLWPSFKEVSIRETIQEVATYSQERQKSETQKENTKSKYPQLSNLSHVLEFPLMFGRWTRLMDEQYAASTSAQWGENRLKTFHETFFRASASFPKESYVLVLGIIISGYKLMTSIYSKKVYYGAIPLLYFAANYVFILLFMRINWDRYYLPTVITGKLIVAFAMYEASRMIWVILSKSTKLISAQR
jgi:4-amino-4-deoxy-L-arabinose transferase-like glycosyltransferase